MFVTIRSAFMFETFEHLNFEFVSDFGIRISDFAQPKSCDFIRFPS